MVRNKMKHTMQQDEYDCGAACVSTILKYYGKGCNLNEIRNKLKTDVSGTKLSNISKFMSSLGFENKTYKVKVDDIEGVFNSIMFPCLAVVDGGTMKHYVVLYGLKGNKLIVSNPAEYKLKKEKLSDFVQHFTGILMVIQSNQEEKLKSKSNNHIKKISHKYFFKVLVENKKFLSSTFIISLLVTICSIASSYFLGILIDAIIPYNLTESLDMIVIIFIGIVVGQCSFQLLRNMLIIRTSRKVEKKLTQEYFSHLLKLPFSFFEKREIGDFISRFNDGLTLTDLVSNTVVTAFVDLLLIFITGILLFRTNITLFTVAMIPIILYVAIMYFFFEKTNIKNKKVMGNHADVNSFFIQVLNGVENIKSLNIEKYIEFITDTKLYNYISEALKLDNINNLNDYCKSLIQAVFYFIIFWFGTKQIFLGKLSLGGLLVFNSLLAYFTGSIEKIIKLQPTIQKSVVAIDRFFEILDYREIENCSQETYLDEGIDNIQISNLNFEYHNGEIVLENISLSVCRGETVAFVGESGAGKSTLAKLLIKLWNVDDEMIFINGKNLNDINLNSLRQRIFYVNEKKFFIKGTILDNLCLGNQFEQSEIDKACKNACIHEFIDKLPGKYNYPLLENAKNLSLGQIQRIALARVLLHKPDVIIFDEVINNVDKKNVLTILKNLKKYECIKIFITHDLYEEDYYDKIYNFTNKNVTLLTEMRAIS